MPWASSTNCMKYTFEYPSKKISPSGLKTSGGERGIRTPGPLTVNGFQDRRNRPLCHLSAANI